MRTFENHPRLRAGALVVCSVVTAARGVAYFDSSRSARALNWIDGALPLEAWAAIWISAAVFIFAGIWWRPATRWAMNAAVTLWMLWGGSYMVAWLVDDYATRVWLSGSTMLGFGALTFICAALMEIPNPSNDEAAQERQEGERWSGAE